MTELIERRDFDSRLSGDTLTIIVRASLVETVPPDIRRPAWARPRNQPLAAPQPWPPNEFKVWCRRWRERVITHWHKRFVLTPAGAHTTAALAGRALDEGALQCHLELLVRGIDESFREPAHLRIRVDYFPPGSIGNRSFNAMSEGDRAEEINAYLDNDDIDAEALPSDGSMQTQVVHEFGHHLGLHHRCSDGTYCRGQPRSRRGDTMAGGDDMHPWHAEPWLRRLRDHGHRAGELWFATVRSSGESNEGVRPDRGTDQQRQAAMRGEAGLSDEDVFAIVAGVVAGAAVLAAAIAIGIAVADE